MKSTSSRCALVVLLATLTAAVTGCLREGYVPPANLNEQTGARVKLGSLRPLKDKYRYLKLDVWVLGKDKCSKGGFLDAFKIHDTPFPSFMAPAGRTVEIYATWSEHRIKLSFTKQCLTTISFVPEAGKEYEYVFQEPGDDELWRSSILETYRDEQGRRMQRPLTSQNPRSCPHPNTTWTGPTSKATTSDVPIPPFKI